MNMLHISQSGKVEIIQVEHPTGDHITRLFNNYLKHPCVCAKQHTGFSVENIDLVLEIYAENIYEVDRVKYIGQNNMILPHIIGDIIVAVRLESDGHGIYLSINDSHKITPMRFIINMLTILRNSITVGSWTKAIIPPIISDLVFDWLNAWVNLGLKQHAGIIARRKLHNIIQKMSDDVATELLRKLNKPKITEDSRTDLLELITSMSDNAAIMLVKRMFTGKELRANASKKQRIN